MKIQHINHASLLIEGNGKYILTDPWVISPAFGGWTQNPYPPTELIEKIISIPSEDLLVAVSHGHDDHLDEFFISSHLRESNFIVPKYKSPGTRNRLRKLIAGDLIEIGEKEINLNGFNLSAFIQEDYTDADGIIAIRTEDNLCIHANDNWHEYTDNLISKIKVLINKTPKGKSVFLTQCGIADCYPWNYPNLSDEECPNIISERAEGFKKAIKSNSKRLGFDIAYTYANQSKLNKPHTRNISKTPYDLVQRKMEPSTQQLNPKDYFNNSEYKKHEPFDFFNSTIFESCFLEYQNLARRYCKNENVFFETSPPKKQEKECVYYITDELTWIKILTGELTLESISIGGLGNVFKENTFNSREIHYKIGNFGYIAQNNIKNKGLNYYFNR